ncbi:MAG: hypothetical protein GEU28_08030 [Dehalococcoidia bacterium]|nr:hypothetical protein [Dehalococcoidia bacterium]
MKHLLALALAFLALAFVSAVSAGTPPDLGAGRVTDETGAFDDGDIEAIEDALDGVQDEDGVDLYVLFVDDTGSADPGPVADDVAEAEGLGGDDALLVVVLDDQLTRIWVSDSLTDEISIDEQDDAVSAANDHFADGDFTRGVIDAARELGDATGAGGGGGGLSISAGAIAGLLIALGILGLVVMWFLGLWQSERFKKRTAEEKDRQTGELARRANAALVDTDEDLREADQEIGFAEAQFSESEVAPFRMAIAAARQELSSAFHLRQQLDDDKPEDVDTRRRLLEQILAHCERASTQVAEQAGRLADLREMEKNAPSVLEKLPEDLLRLEERARSSHGAFERLAAYNPASWNPVRGNGTEAEKRIAFARSRVEAGSQALNSADRRAAARAAGEAQAAAGEAGKLLDAIDHIETSLAEARVELPGEIAAATADVEAARNFLRSEQGVGAGQDFRANLDQAEALLRSAEQEASAPSPDYLAAFKNARQANAMSDEVLAGAREAGEQRKRQEAAYSSAVRGAQTSYTRAEDFIGGRRQGIGNQARTRLAEARRYLDAARNMGAGDEGIKQAGQAERLADEAYRLASNDFNGYDRGRSGGGIFPVLLGGGGWGRSGGWGGSRWGRSSSRRSGGFRGGRSSGRRFGGGGGRSRGGRF